MARWPLACLVLITALAGCAQVAPHDEAVPAPRSSPMLRVATYNVSLYDEAAGGLVAQLEAGHAGAASVAAVLQRIRPDLVLLNEFDYDAAHRAAELFQRRYLEVPQADGGPALHYPYRYLAPVNTGVQSGLDLGGDGHVGGEGRTRGNDAWGYGLHPGQYGMLVLSRYPIDAAQVRSFRLLRWSTMPGARVPVDPANGQPWYSPEVWAQLRLSSKSHWDVPVDTPLGRLHFLVSHPTPPVFDGPEDRNGARNADEIRLWAEYLSADAADAAGGATAADANSASGVNREVGAVGATRREAWLCDDNGRCGGLAQDARFVIAGDLNNDPADGDGRHEAIMELLEHPRVLRMATPRSEGGEQVGRAYAERGIARRGSPAHATGDFGERVGTLRLDYVLPSVGLEPAGSGVFWPAAGEPGAAAAAVSDHRLVWVDLMVP